MIFKWLVLLGFDTASVDMPPKEKKKDKSAFSYHKASREFDLNNLDWEKCKSVRPAFPFFVSFSFYLYFSIPLLTNFAKAILICCMWNSTNASEYFWPQNNIPIITRICTNTSVINMCMKKKKKVRV